MKAKISYSFNGKEYRNLENLAIDMSKNWKAALAELKSGNLLNQVKEYYPHIAINTDLEFKRCKYLDNVLTMFLHFIAPKLGVCIKGMFFKNLKEIAKYMADQHPVILQGVVAFVEDKCIEHLFLEEVVAKSDELVQLLPKIEANIQNPFVYYYLFKQFTQDTTAKDINFYLSYIAASSQPLEFTYNLTHNDDFLYQLSKIVGFDGAFAYAINEDFLFGLYDIVKNHTKVKFTDIVLKGYHIDMLIDYVNYSYVKEGKKVYKQYKKVSKKFRKGRNHTVKFAKEIYNLYNEFVQQYQKGNITALEEVYAIDKNICNTMVSQAYLDKVNNVVEGQQEFETKLMFGREDAVQIAKTAHSLRIYKKYSKTKSRFAWFNLILMVLIVGAGFALKQTGYETVTDAVLNSLIFYSAIGAILNLHILRKNRRSVKTMNKYFDENCYMTADTKQLNEYEYKKVTKKITYHYNLWSTLVVTLSMFQLFQFILIVVLGKVNAESSIAVALAGFAAINVILAPALGFLFSVFKKNKKASYTIKVFFYILLISLLCVGALFII